MNTAASRRLLQYGYAAEPPARIPLRAGPWSMDFLDGDLRNLSLNQTEVLQRLCVLVRGPEWETLPRVIVCAEVEARERSFTIVCDCESRVGEVDFRWRLRAEGSEQGEVRYRFEGVALSSFYANRIGICAIHSTAGFCGKTISVTMLDGATKRILLTNEIAPWPIFTDANSICYELADLPPIRLRFSGDSFEAEDQRNWGDASFKVYSGPLRLPHPYLVEKGSSVTQSARLAMTSPVRPHPGTMETNSLHISGLSGPAQPQIGLGFSSAVELDPQQMCLLRALKPAFLSARYDCFDSRGKELIASAAALSRLLDVPLEIRLDSIRIERDFFNQVLNQTTVCRWLIEAPSQSDAGALSSLPGDAQIYCGSERGFVEINRNRWIARQRDGVWFPFDPQVHASDSDSLVENLPAQAAVVDEARRLAMGAPVAVSPITLGRSNVQGLSADPRHASLFAAAWTVGSLKHLAAGQAGSVAYFDVAGGGGVIRGNGAAPPIDSAEPLRSTVYPVYHVLAAAAEFAGGEALPTRSTNPSRIEGVALRRGERIRLLLTNFSREGQIVSVHADSDCRWSHSRSLDETNCREAMENPLHWRNRTPNKLPRAIGPVDVTVPPLSVVMLDGAVRESAR
jgi:D-apionolactonase